MSHVLEHLPDPSGYLLKLSNIINKDGMLFIEVPNEAGMLIRRYIKYNSRNSGHLYFYSKETLLQLFSNLETWELLDISYSGIGAHDWVSGNKQIGSFFGQTEDETAI